MAQYAEREHFIPLRIPDLVDLLCSDRGPGGNHPLDAEEQASFRRFADAAAACVHAQCHAHLQRLKNAYAPFDPDADTRPLRQLSPQERAHACQHLLAEFCHLMERANYIRLNRSEIEQIMQGASDWGVDMDVEWKCFEILEIFVRGKGIGKRLRRRWYRLFKTETVTVPIFQRVVLVVKQKAHRRLGRNADTQSVFLKLFKDIPQMDIEMLLPGTRLKMPWKARLQLGGSAAGTVGYVGFKLSSTSLSGLTATLTGGAGLLGLLTLYTPLALILGYGYKTYASFQTTRQTYMLQLHQSLYYQNLDNNAGVFHRLMDEAEEQELREILLAYFYLWRYAQADGWTARELDDYVEMDLERRLNMKVDFEIDDALAKLRRLDLVECRQSTSAVATDELLASQTSPQERFRAIPIEQATPKLLRLAVSTVSVSETVGSIVTAELSDTPPAGDRHGQLVPQ
ncbi:MAG: TMEM143 family protein [Gemmataceae bacterium]|nr:TMEM143 family protein [Gemmataceae bacterium]MCS7270682.1 TMEM143 family protein [Gemmataceae bacterium]MDW8242500.1 DUF3754 domain-containing protein [Thermogemmata sp.]